MQISFKPTKLNRDVDSEGQLVLADDRIVAILCKLSALQEEAAGRWFLEWGVEPFSHDHPDFKDLNEAQDWFAQRLKR